MGFMEKKVAMELTDSQQSLDGPSTHRFSVFDPLL
jgi:hypothetical protein